MVLLKLTPPAAAEAEDNCTAALALDNTNIKVSPPSSCNMCLRVAWHAHLTVVLTLLHDADPISRLLLNFCCNLSWCNLSETGCYALLL